MSLDPSHELCSGLSRVFDVHDVTSARMSLQVSHLCFSFASMEEYRYYLIHSLGPSVVLFRLMSFASFIMGYVLDLE